MSQKSFFAKTLENFKYHTLVKTLEKLGYTEVLADQDEECILFNFGNDRVSCLNLSKNNQSIEITLLFTGEILSLKTLSDISSLSFANKCSTSRIYPSSDGRIRLNVQYNLTGKIDRKSIKDGMAQIDNCILSIEQYLLYRVSLLEKSEYDLSMFEDLELESFSPQFMAEEMEFLWGTWEKYADSIKAEYEDFYEHPQEERLLSLIAACRLFEKENKVKLSEIGDKLFDELVESRELLQLAKSNYGIN